MSGPHSEQTVHESSGHQANVYTPSKTRLRIFLGRSIVCSALGIPAAIKTIEDLASHSELAQKVVAPEAGFTALMLLGAISYGVAYIRGRATRQHMSNAQAGIAPPVQEAGQPEVPADEMIDLPPLPPPMLDDSRWA